ncbi:hypothetical protein ABKN59_009794 [Abortiporus biennis]
MFGETESQATHTGDWTLLSVYFSPWFPSSHFYEIKRLFDYPPRHEEELWILKPCFRPYSTTGSPILNYQTPQAIFPFLDLTLDV